MDNNMNNTENMTENTVEEVATENLPVEAGCGILPKNQDLTITGNVAIVNTTAVKAGLTGFAAGALAVPIIKKLVVTFKGLRERRKLRKQIAENMALHETAEALTKPAKKKSSNTGETTAE